MNKSSVSVKIVPFTITDYSLKVYLTEKKLPGGILPGGELLDESAKRIFGSKVGLPVGNNYIEQLYTISYSQNSINHIDIVFYILLPSHKLKHFAKNNWFNIEKINTALIDKEIITYGLQRLRWKVEYTNVVYSLLPEEFTLSQLQQTYEAILGRSLDKRNFRKKILSLGLLKLSGKKLIGVKARPAQIYEFKKREPVRVRVF